MPIVNQIGDIAMRQRRTARPRRERPLELGPRLRALRKGQQLTLQEVARLTGVSTSALSKIERNDLSPTLTTLQRIASGLQVELSALLGDEPGHAPTTGRRSIARAGQGDNLNNATCNNKLLCADLKDKCFTPIRTVVKARSPEDYEAWGVSDGEIFLTVLKGELVIHSRIYEPLVLYPGDSMYYDASTEHCWTSQGDVDAELIWVLGTRTA
ncbi:helix-turn-helix domain-containing protein [Paracoccus denitrificans]|uniref:helix-turn-helix domain-containing protein n=1 Tax=Paracoccus denitrificans TaxID=266 RepID=UPI000CEC64B2|nr:XRE family transcriptional regulator [Paracoccus denitrificans]